MLNISRCEKYFRQTVAGKKVQYTFPVDLTAFEAVKINLDAVPYHSWQNA
jgi:hypothetical protein